LGEDVGPDAAGVNEEVAATGMVRAADDPSPTPLVDGECEGAGDEWDTEGVEATDCCDEDVDDLTGAAAPA
jgi:hypothetical protein